MGIFDCLFNRYIPKSSEFDDHVVVVRPLNGTTFASGLAYAFDDEGYDERLKEVCTKQYFAVLINKVNDILFNNFPCPGCQGIGYLLCLPSAGLCMILPMHQAREARIKVDQYLAQNKIYWSDKGFEVTLQQKCLTSWLEFKILPKSENKQINVQVDDQC